MIKNYELGHGSVTRVSFLFATRNPTLSLVNKMLILHRNSFKFATKGVVYIYNTTLLSESVLKMITSGSLISVRFRIV